MVMWVDQHVHTATPTCTRPLTLTQGCNALCSSPSTDCKYGFMFVFTYRHLVIPSISDYYILCCCCHATTTTTTATTATTTTTTTVCLYLYYIMQNTINIQNILTLIPHTKVRDRLWVYSISYFSFQFHFCFFHFYMMLVLRLTFAWGMGGWVGISLLLFCPFIHASKSV